jgi:dolichol-phosphate mannosyltransferase
MQSWGSGPEVSLVVPVHNEAENLVPLVSEIRAALDSGFDYELVCVDDGSQDRTGELLNSLAAGFPRLRVIAHHDRAGQSAALVSGVRAARGSWIVTLDGDGQNDPADIPRLLAAARDPNADPGLRLVIGNRSWRQDSLAKRVSSRIANTVRSRLLGDATPDTGCGLKLFSREAFLAIPQFDHMHRFLPALFLCSGWRITSVKVNHRPRRHGASHYGIFDRLWAGVVDLIGVQWLQHRRLPPGLGEKPDGR